MEMQGNFLVKLLSVGLCTIEPCFWNVCGWCLSGGMGISVRREFNFNRSP